MSQSFLRRTPIQLLLLGLLLFVIASTVPPLAIAQMRPLPSGLSADFVTRPAPTLLLTATPAGGGQLSPENLRRPECRTPDPALLPYSCLVETVETRQVTTLTTSDAPEKSDVSVDALLQVRGGPGGEAVITEINDSVRLDRRSSYPVSDPVSHLTISVPALDQGMAGEGSVREGLQYFFPMPTSRESYAWFDLTAREPLWLDYVRETRHNGVDAYEFHQSVSGIDLSSHADTAVELRVEEQIELDRAADSGRGVPWYAVRRTVWVEPESGTIVDIHTEPHLYLAAGADEAEERAFAPDTDYTIYHTASSWDEETLAHERERAQGTVDTLRGLQIMAVLLKTLALILAVWGTVLLLLERRERHAR